MAHNPWLLSSDDVVKKTRRFADPRAWGAWHNERDPAEIEITTGGSPTPDEVKRLEDLGVGRFTIMPPGFTRDAVEAGLEKLGDELFSKF